MDLETVVAEEGTVEGSVEDEEEVVVRQGAVVELHGVERVEQEEAPNDYRMIALNSPTSEHLEC